MTDDFKYVSSISVNHEEVKFYLNRFDEFGTVQESSNISTDFKSANTLSHELEFHNVDPSKCPEPFLVLTRNQAQALYAAFNSLNTFKREEANESQREAT